jgi:hypothetical protein
VAHKIYSRINTGEDANTTEQILKDKDFIDHFFLSRDLYESRFVEGKAIAMREVARFLLSKGIDIQLVLEGTGLPIEEIEQIKKTS